MRTFFILLALLLVLPTVSPAQGLAADEPLSYGAAVIGHSTRPEMEAYLREPLHCIPGPGNEPGRVVELCRSRNPDSDRNPQALFVNGRLRAYRFFLPRELTAHVAVTTLEENYGTLLHLNPGDIRSGGLRFWSFAVRPYQLLLYESRNSSTGAIRLRLHLSDGTEFERTRR